MNQLLLDVSVESCRGEAKFFKRNVRKLFLLSEFIVRSKVPDVPLIRSFTSFEFAMAVMTSGATL